MPTYVFECHACTHEFSVDTSWSRKDETRCPECDSDALKEMFGRYSLNVMTASSASSAASKAHECARPADG